MTDTRDKIRRMLELAYSYGMLESDGVDHIMMSREFGVHLSETSFNEDFQKKWSHVHPEEEFMKVLILESVLSWVQNVKGDYETLSTETAVDLAHLIWSYYKSGEGLKKVG